LFSDPDDRSDAGDGLESVVEAPRVPADAFQNVVGSSQAIRHAIEQGCKIALHPGTAVLIQGETGTGKELFARGLHYSSLGADEPFVAINCSTIPENLLESELFGHEKGAYSGAHAQKRGLLEFAGKGTVFLDEISDLPLALQPKLLRALQERRIRRVGGLHEVKISCRVVAATNQDLLSVANAGKFRADLYYRLSGFSIDLPPLRERREDVEIMARFFVNQLAHEHGLRPRPFSALALEALCAHDWPGNVRELKNAVESALLLSEGDYIQREHIVLRRRASVYAPLPAEQGGSTIVIPETGITLDEVERQAIEAMLRITSYNTSKAARLLGISRPTIIRKMEKYNLRGSSDVA
jgi:DNA-binding NtrC family response regulator